MPFEFTKTRFLICEGDDDKGFLETLIRERGLPEFQVCHAAECNTAGSDGKGVGGKTGLNHSLAGFKPIRGYREVRALLIVTDNDRADSFVDTQNAIRINQHIPPGDPNTIGSIDGKPVAVLMIPSYADYGDLEKLCFPEIVRVWPKAEECVTAFLACTGADKWAKTSSINKAKARSATVGFNEDDPYRGIGHLFRNGTLSTGNPCFNHIADFLGRFDTFVGI